MADPVTKKPVGRPRSDIDTRVIAVRIPIALGERLDRYVDLASSQGRGMKASINSIVGYAIEFFLDAEEKPQGSARPEPQQRPSTPVRDTSAGLRQKFENMSSGRKRIVGILQQYPDGLSPAQTRKLLKTEQDVSSTMERMSENGLLYRVEKGRYVVPEQVLALLEEIESE